MDKLFLAFMSLFMSQVISHRGKLERRERLCLGIAICFLVLYFSWDSINLSPELKKSLDNVASNGWTWLGIIMLMWIYLAFITYPRSFVEITNLEPGQKVNREESILGLVYPSDTPVQLFILSGDNYWYPRQARIDGAAWSVTAKIGDKESPANSHKLVAIAGAPKVNAKVLKLPRGQAKSRVITVQRVV